MNKALRITLSLLLSVFILLGGSGLILGKMVCLKSGHTVFAAKEMKDCCESPDSDFSFEAQCCDISSISFYQSHFIPEGHTLLKSPPAIFVSVSPADLVSFLSEKVHAPVCDSESGSIPAYSGAKAQVFLSHFRI